MTDSLVHGLVCLDIMCIISTQKHVVLVIVVTIKVVLTQ